MQYLTFFNSNLSHRPKSYKTDQVGSCGLSLNHSISGLQWSNEMGQKPCYRGLNIVVKNICYHDFKYGLVFLIFFDLIGAFLLTHAVDEDLVNIWSKLGLWWRSDQDYPSSTECIFCNTWLPPPQIFAIKPPILVILVPEDRYESLLSIDTKKFQ